MYPATWSFRQSLIGAQAGLFRIRRAEIHGIYETGGSSEPDTQRSVEKWSDDPDLEDLA
jgi:hypothetical protein